MIYRIYYNIKIHISICELIVDVFMSIHFQLQIQFQIHLHIILLFPLQEFMTDKAPQTNPDFLNLKVKSQDGQQVFFKIKKTTQFKKLMDAYCQRQNLAIANVRFLFDGDRITETQTPKDMNMQNGDEIDVVIQQIGGNKY